MILISCFFKAMGSTSFIRHDHYIEKEILVLHEAKPFQRFEQQT
jgi:hypothetical protein